MKVLLIKAPYKDVYGPIKLAAGNYFLLGLGYIAAYLKRHGHEVFMLDPEVERLTYSDITSRIKKLSPRLIGISASTPDFSNALKIAEIARCDNSGFVLLGGVHASALPEYILTKYPGVFDAICIGEGEETALEVCRFLNGEIKSLSEIKGICFNDNGKPLKTPPRPFMSNLDGLPFPARDLIDLDLYKPHAFNSRKGRTATIITSRGCPFRCNFCASKLTLGGIFRARSAEGVFDEIKYLVEKHGVNHILIQDDTFTYNMDRAKEICRKIIRARLNIEWFCFSQVTKVDEELLGLMKKAGCYCIGYGVESADKEVLKSICKPITVEASDYAIRAARKKGLRVQAYYVFGNKNDTRETIEKTIKFACGVPSTLSFFNKLVAYPGTQLFDEYFGKDYDNISWGEFVPMGVNVTVSSNRLNKHELQKLIVKANIKFYLRPSQLFEIFISIRSLSELLAYLKGGLALLLQIMSWRRRVKI